MEVKKSWKLKKSFVDKIKLYEKEIIILIIFEIRITKLALFESENFLELKDSTKLAYFKLIHNCKIDGTFDNSLKDKLKITDEAIKDLFDHEFLIFCSKNNNYYFSFWWDYHEVKMLKAIYHNNKKLINYDILEADDKTLDGIKRIHINLFPKEKYEIVQNIEKNIDGFAYEIN